MPFVSSSATPVAIDIEPSVTMKGETRRNATLKPFTRPTAKPLRRPASTPSSTTRAVCPGATPLAQTIVNALTTLASGTTAPTDRSKPPTISTIICPADMMTR